MKTDPTSEITAAANDRTVKRLGYTSLAASLLVLWPVSLVLAIISLVKAKRHGRSNAIGLVALAFSVMSFIAFLLVVLIAYAGIYQSSHPLNVNDRDEPSIIRSFDEQSK